MRQDMSIEIECMPDSPNNKTRACVIDKKGLMPNEYGRETLLIE
jgi:hypothetical protein